MKVLAFFFDLSEDLINFTSNFIDMGLLSS